MQGAKFIFISIQLNHKTNVKCGNLLFYFPFYCPSGKPRAKMKFNGHFDNKIFASFYNLLTTIHIFAA